MGSNADLLQGTLDLLILRTLAVGGEAWLGNCATLVLNQAGSEAQ